jgi:DNA-binding NarL/FixJ family response regulator
MTASQTSPRKPKALLLSSAPVRHAALEHALIARGFDVRSSAGNENALTLLLDELLTLDVLVLELRLEGYDARSMLRLVRCAGGESELPIVVASLGLDASVAACLAREGADAALDLGRGADDAADTVLRLAMNGRSHERRPRFAPTYTARLALPALAA